MPEIDPMPQQLFPALSKLSPSQHHFLIMQIRRLAIKSLPDICNGASDNTLYVKVSDVLTQLLAIGKCLR